jgi:hypothetical protein
MSEQTQTSNDFFTDLENVRPFLKMAFEGFAGDGKTYTMASVAIGLHKLIGSTKPIAVIDTERAMDKLGPLFKEAGITVKVNNSRSLAGIKRAMELCAEGYADILLIDSITHTWESYKQAYIDSCNARNPKWVKTGLEFQDWNVIKPGWKKDFSDAFVMANTHIMFAGRAGYEYENEVNEHTKKREIFKSGIKMKAENETAFEPDILVLMEKKQEILTDKKKIWREATVIKDRTTMIDGKTFQNPTFDNFYPAIKQLLDGTLKDTYGLDIPDNFEDFESKYGMMKREKEILISEIEGCFALMGLGTGAKDKQVKAWSLDKIFKVKSIDGLDRQGNTDIRKGLIILKTYAEKYATYLGECLDAATELDPKKVLEILNESKEVQPS